MQSDYEKLDHFTVNPPLKCEKCGETQIKYKGIGEYACEICGFLMYDDYGKVRNYIEENPGATINDVSINVGVSKEKIRRLLREDRIQIAPDSPTFLRCDICGTDIRSGKYCVKCAQEMNNKKAAANTRVSSISGGFTKAHGDGTGAKRFDRK